MKLYVANLSNRVTNADLKAAFLGHGDVADVNVIFDRDTGRSRGFGFVEMSNASPVEAMQDIELDGKRLTVTLKTEDQI